MKRYLFTILTITVLLAVNANLWARGVEAPSPDLPPPGFYVSPADVFGCSAAGIAVTDPVLRPFADRVYREHDGNDELEICDAMFTGVEIGMGLGPFSLTGPVTMRTTNRALSTAGLFDAEIVSLSLSGGIGSMNVELRQDPTRASTGQTEILDLGGGLYHIDSFFDVFTELSVDGGPWIACDDAMYMVLVPEPATICLLGLGLLTLRRKRRA